MASSQERLKMDGIRASKSIRANSLLYDELPCVQVLLRKYHDRLCEFCNARSNKLTACPSCELVKYCSEDCQKADRDHILECKLLKNLPPHYTDFVRLVGKIMLILNERGPEAIRLEKSLQGMPVNANFTELEGKFPERNALFQYTSFVVEILYWCVRSFVGYDIGHDKNKVMDVIKKVNYNTVVNVDDGFHMIAYYIFLGFTKFTRECIPNTRMKMRHHTLQLWTLRPLEKGEEITISSRNNFSKNVVPFDRTYYPCECTDCSKPIQESTLRKVKNETLAYGVIKDSLKLLDKLANRRHIFWEEQLVEVNNMLARQKNALGCEHILYMGMLTFKVERMPERLKQREVLNELTAIRDEIYGGQIPVSGRGLFSPRWSCDVQDNYASRLY